MRPWLAACVLAVACSGAASAATVEDILDAVNQNISPDELHEPGSQARAKAIAGLLAGTLDLSASQLNDLKLALAEAWLDAMQPDQCDAVVKAVLAADPTPEQKERAGLAFVAAWQLGLAAATEPAKYPSALAAIAPMGELGPRVLARAEVAEAGHVLAQVDDKGKPLHGKDAIALYDSALGHLKASPAAERIPLYHLRLLGMESMGQKPDAVQQWLLAHQDDPAAVEVAESAFTNGQRMLGQKAPALKLKRLDGKDGAISLADYQGKTVLIAFFASWHDLSRALAPTLAAYASKHKAELVVIGVSLDTKDTVKDIPGWVAQTGTDYPVVGDGLGWDGDTAASFQVDKIPALILVGPDGRVKANDLVGSTPDATMANLDAALGHAAEHASAVGGPGAPKPAADGDAAGAVVP
jgi:thiol-disulfide isomerase/thioredoxin